MSHCVPIADLDIYKLVESTIKKRKFTNHGCGRRERVETWYCWCQKTRNKQSHVIRTLRWTCNIFSIINLSHHLHHSQRWWRGMSFFLSLFIFTNIQLQYDLDLWLPNPEPPPHPFLAQNTSQRGVSSLLLPTTPLSPPLLVLETRDGGAFLFPLQSGNERNRAQTTPGASFGPTVCVFFCFLSHFTDSN